MNTGTWIAICIALAVVFFAIGFIVCWVIPHFFKKVLDFRY